MIQTKDIKFRKLCFNGHLRYTSTNVHKHTLFLYFSDFSNFFYEKENKAKLQINKQKHVKQRQESKTHKYCKNKNKKGREREREKVTKSLGAFFLPHLGRTFLFCKTLIRW